MHPDEDDGSQRPAMFMETLYMILQGPVAYVPGGQRHPISFIAARDIAKAAVQAFRWKFSERYELAGPDTVTFDEAFERQELEHLDRTYTNPAKPFRKR